MEYFLSVIDPSVPQILEAEKDYLLVYKPAGMHSAPLAKSPDNNILSWCFAYFPEIADLADKDSSGNNNLQGKIQGRQAGEGGLLHRLDYETQGLILIARTLQGMERLIEQQKQGKIIKEYCAITAESKTALPGFPEDKPALPFWVFREKHRSGDSISIKSAFRPYGPGRKSVRPFSTNDNIPMRNDTRAINRSMNIAFDGSRPYVTNIVEAKLLLAGEVHDPDTHKPEETNIKDFGFLRLRIIRGFRHQIRCHLAWADRPILNDDLYGGLSFGKGLLALRAYAITFTEPSSGKTRTLSIPPLSLEDI